ncbi:MAG: sulfur carrier protein ThiS [Opitutales bacterium]
MADFIQIIANGQSYQVAPGTALPSFIEEQGLPPRQVVVERNGHPVVASELPETILEDGDHLEIVRIVAGG